MIYNAKGQLTRSPPIQSPSPAATRGSFHLPPACHPIGNAGASPGRCPFRSSTATPRSSPPNWHRVPDTQRQNNSSPPADILQNVGANLIPHLQDILMCLETPAPRSQDPRTTPPSQNPQATALFDFQASASELCHSSSRPRSSAIYLLLSPNSSTILGTSNQRLNRQCRSTSMTKITVGNDELHFNSIPVARTTSPVADI